ncbi:flagellar hook assembly protein FlgD [Pseudomonas sp. DTU_2021_1001937_2_SI_NGA_ILE_001]|uniref:flagellar hook assembly protein FlgD n=1 Tax=Pseudomonas sp. DTU_2021_1001937_2_SI_NGA_ILE_001 TaxID=3077589 RepID=UPI0028FC19D4|nr:flagellar hook assembly protein FlgD [Pseudomonas sp. DTU_2021_1001937_2_SI_NGA_ILE_001]WNW11159.1 flagellar hook assembly protein FlgD [Pseudomonas sp. DTU_2021_1001937_2_SI_NGA_ILE_001]
MAVENDVSKNFVNSLQNPTSSAKSEQKTGTSALGKDAFLQLLVTQMKNQNPLDPQDNTEFVSQLAQFSSLESMQNLTSSVDAIATSYKSSQALQASSLVGRSVTVDTGTVYLDPAKGLTGSVVLPASSASTTISVYDADNNLVDTIDLGAQSAGTQSFTWDGTGSDGAALAAGNYTFKANASISGTGTALTTYLPATVNSVTTAASGSDMTLNLAGGSSIALSKVQTIGL